jgi:hypothetical protein
VKFQSMPNMINWIKIKNFIFLNSSKGLNSDE